MYMFGGWHEGELADMRDLWAFDILTGNWTCLCEGDPDTPGCMTQGDPPTFRSFHAAEFQRDTNQIVIAFGSGQNDVLTLDLGSLTWNSPLGPEPPDDAPPFRGAVKSVAVPNAAGLPPPYSPGIWYFGGSKEYKADLGPSYNDMWNFDGAWKCISCGDMQGCGSPFAPPWWKGCN